MLFYAILMVYVFLVGIVLYHDNTENSKIKNSVYFLIACLPLFIIAAFRGANVGSDTNTYIRIFYDIMDTPDIFTSNMRYETGFMIFCKVLQLISSHHQILFIATSFVVYASVFRFIYKYSNMVWLSVFLLISMRFQYFFMTGIRQSIAMAIVLFSYNFIQKRNFLKFLFCILFAFTFHKSVIICLILYPLSYLTFNLKIVLLIIFVSLFIFAFFNTFLNIALMLFPQYSGYTQGEKFGAFLLANIIILIIQSCIFFVGFVTGYSSQKNTNGTMKIYQKKFIESDFLSYTMLISALTCMFALKGSTLDRFYIYFQIFLLIFIPKAIGFLRESRYSTLLILSVILFTFAYNMVILYYRPEWSSVVPYKFFW